MKASLIRRVAIALTPDTNKDKVVVALRGATINMINTAMRLLGGLCEKIHLRDIMSPVIINGKCHREWQILCLHPDTLKLAPQEWLTLIKSALIRINDLKRATEKMVAESERLVRAADIEHYGPLSKYARPYLAY